MSTPQLSAIDWSALGNPTPALSAIDLSALGTSDGPDPTPGLPPDLNAIDLSALSSLTPDLSSIDLSALDGPDGPDGPVNAATLEFSASGVGAVPYVGQGSVDLSLSASGAGYWQDVASGSAMLSLEAVGQGSWGFSGDGAPVLSLSAAGAGYQDWLSKIPPIQLQEVYRLVITGAADGLSDLHIGGISSWQATNQAGGRSSYVQAVIPAAEALLPDIQARQNGELVIQKGYKFSTGETRYEEVLRSRFDTLRPDRGQRALTVTVSGYLPGTAAFSGSRTLTGIRTISVQNAKRRVRCDIDLFLQPGMTVTAMGETFRAGYINYYVSQTDKFCEVGER